MLTKEELPACPVATTVQLIGSKWKLLILRNLLARPWRFNELKKDLEGISQKVLTVSSSAQFTPKCRRGWNMPSLTWASPCAPFSKPWKSGERIIRSPCPIERARYFPHCVLIIAAAL